MHASGNGVGSEKSPINSTRSSTKVKEEQMEFDHQPTSDDEDQHACVKKLMQQQTKFTVTSELETPLEGNERPLGMGRTEYAEEVVRLNSRSSKGKRKMEMMDSVNTNFRVCNSSVMKRAKEDQSNLDPQFPSFLKLMHHSHVTKGFLLRIPSRFCEANMPKDDETVVLENESGKEYKTKYLARSNGLSGGWKGFSVRHNLLEGDVVIFHLVRFCKFKVYIVRASSSRETDGALGNLNLPPHAKERDPGIYDGTNNTRCDNAKEKSHPSYSRDNCRNDSLTKINKNVRKARYESENGEDFPSENVSVAGCQGSFIDFKEFNIMVNGFNVDSMVTEDMRRKYYELCLAQNSYLHHGLLKSINHILATGIILETTTIADYIRGCKLSTSDDDFAMWDKRLKVLEVSGMNVGFLSSRLSYLVSLATKTRQTPESKRYAEAKLERDCMEQEIQSLKPKLRELKQATRKLEIEMDVLGSKIQIYKRTFEEEANSPWSRDPRK